MSLVISVHFSIHFVLGIASLDYLDIYNIIVSIYKSIVSCTNTTYHSNSNQESGTLIYSVMILGESLLFSLSLIDCGAILFLLVYFIITLSDLECDYLNAQECCEKLNYWLLPKYIAHSFVTFLLLLHGQVLLFVVNLPMFIWLTFEYLTIPKGNLGAYDPAEIHNRGQLKKHLRDVMIYVGYYLIFFFIYLYCFILAILKGDPIQRGLEDQIVTEI